MVKLLEKVSLFSEISKIFSDKEQDLEKEAKRISKVFRTHDVATRIYIIKKLQDDLIVDAKEELLVAQQNIKELSLYLRNVNEKLV